MSTQNTDFSPAGSDGASPPSDFAYARDPSATPRADGQSIWRYTVAPGQTLSDIARQVYGKAGLWQAIFESNRDQLDSPDLLRPGQVLVIPAADDAFRSGTNP